jgi:hypothetical protein
VPQLPRVRYRRTRVLNLCGGRGDVFVALRSQVLLAVFRSTLSVSNLGSSLTRRSVIQISVRQPTLPPGAIRRRSVMDVAISNPGRQARLRHSPKRRGALLFYLIGGSASLLVTANRRSANGSSPCPS